MTAPRRSDDAAVADGLIKRYGGRTVLDGIDLRVRRGEIVALLGPNGAGKTTTVEILEGYRRPDGGTVRVLGVAPVAAGPDWRARVGVMLQEGGIDPRVTPSEVVALFARFHARPRAVNDVLETVGLREVASTRYRRLSGGERQRLALALALVGRPDVLFLDEPTAGMDPAAKVATRDLLRTLRSEGAAIVLTTHDLRDVEELADTVVVLHRGRVVASGATAAVGGKEPSIRLELAPTAEPGGLERALRARWPTARVTPLEGRALVVEGVPVGAAVVSVIALWAAEHERLIVDLRAGAPSLEERYLELTGDIPPNR